MLVSGNGNFVIANRLADLGALAQCVIANFGNNSTLYFVARNTTSFQVYTGSSNGNFTLSEQLNVANKITMLLNDVRGNGLVDLVYMGTLSSGIVMPENADGTFTQVTTSSFGGTFAGMQFVDATGDGKLFLSKPPPAIQDSSCQPILETVMFKQQRRKYRSIWTHKSWPQVIMTS